jgi:thiamine phosphate synthase YjbQ (UPF0047 family)
MQLVLSSLTIFVVLSMSTLVQLLRRENNDHHNISRLFALSFSPLSVTVRNNNNNIEKRNRNISSILMATTDAQQQQQQQGNLPKSPILGEPICVYHQVEIPTSEKDNPVPRQAIFVEDLTPTLQKLLDDSGMVNGLLTVISRHTTTSLTINEWESRLTQDIAETFLNLVPPDERSISPASREGVTYKHNDIHLRPFGGDNDSDDNNSNSKIDSEEAQRCRENGWNVDDPVQLQAWRDQEPINSHSHLLSIMSGSSSESIPIVDSQMVLGTWQSVLMLDFDGPRNRTVGVQLMGYCSIIS